MYLTLYKRERGGEPSHSCQVIICTQLKVKLFPYTILAKPFSAKLKDPYGQLFSSKQIRCFQPFNFFTLQSLYSWSLLASITRFQQLPELHIYCTGSLSNWSKIERSKFCRKQLLVFFLVPSSSFAFLKRSHIIG